MPTDLRSARRAAPQVIEDRGVFHGTHLVRVRLGDGSDPDVLDFELPLDELEAAPAGGPLGRTSLVQLAGMAVRCHPTRRLRVCQATSRPAEHEGDSEWAWAQREPSDSFEGEAGGDDCTEGVARQMASAAELGPDAGGVQPGLDGFCQALVGHDVLVEAELSAGREDPIKLGERRLLVGNGAKEK